MEVQVFGSERAFGSATGNAREQVHHLFVAAQAVGDILAGQSFDVAQARYPFINRLPSDGGSNALHVKVPALPHFPSRSSFDCGGVGAPNKPDLARYDVQFRVLWLLGAHFVKNHVPEGC